MATEGRRSDRDRLGRAGVAVATYLVAAPIAVLVGVYGVALATGVAFGDLVFALTVATLLVWYSYGRGGDRMETLVFARPASEGDDGIGPEGPTAGRIVAALTATVTLGWLVLLAGYWLG
ncbi:hypothetical protein [Halovivax sp.]|uniref:hypothetical protein n=1 Tax=Halovivax sp. TaxID=1935978 RepID=UPI0025B91697|nr:hypothetical protein [Halovivax sp.]